MNWLTRISTSIVFLSFASSSFAEAAPYYPDQVFGTLFQRVQTEGIFPDYKTFVDASPTRPSNDILSDYENQKLKPEFNLKSFILANFELPPPLPKVEVNPKADMLSHLKSHWPNLVRHPLKSQSTSSLIQLPNPYVVPGGRFREMFYWDSYFTIIGLLGSDEDDLALGMINNFAFLIDEYGYIPNGNRSYFLSRSQPPFFGLMLMAYGEKHGFESIIGFLPQLEQEYAFWMDGQVNSFDASKAKEHLIQVKKGAYLNRYYGSHPYARAEGFGKEMRWASHLTDEDARGEFFRNLRTVCESGWDFSSRWYADGKQKSSIHAMDLIPVDLNALMYSVEDSLAQLFAYKKDTKKSAHYRQRADTRKALIHEIHYDEKTGTYQDYDTTTKSLTGRLTLAMAYPLFTGAATPSAAKRVSATIENKFLMPGGVVTSLINSGEQWDYPNGWAPLQFITVEGLKKYQRTDLALTIAKRWIAHNERVYRETGKMMEKYNVVDIKTKAGGGEYPNQDGFGWTNGVDIAFYDFIQSQK